MINVIHRDNIPTLMPLISTCTGHTCPDCGKEFSHSLLLDNMCYDMKKRLRACEACVDKARGILDPQLSLFNTATSSS